jgi:hypothetical protein
MTFTPMNASMKPRMALAVPSDTMSPGILKNATNTAFTAPSATPITAATPRMGRSPAPG